MFFLADPILVGGLSLLKPALRLMTSYRLPLESKKRLLDGSGANFLKCMFCRANDFADFRPPRTKHWSNAAFYPPVILFDDVVQVGTISNLDGIVLT